MGLPHHETVEDETRIKEIFDKVAGLEETMEKIINKQVAYTDVFLYRL